MAKSATKKATPEKRTVYILMSGSHSRDEGGLRVKYECGDEILLTAEEVERYPGRFLTLSQFKAKLELHAEARATRRRVQDKATPRQQKLQDRSPEAIERNQQLLEIQKETDGSRRTYI